MCSNRSASLPMSQDRDGERCRRLHARVHTCVRVRARGSPASALETRWRQIKLSPFSGAKHSNCLTQGVWEENKKPGSYSGGRRRNKKHPERAAYNLQPNLGSGDQTQPCSELNTELEKCIL